jgi:hypothetical protein
MPTKEKLTSVGKPVPELPVADVERAQQHYRDALGFEIGWLEEAKELALFLAVTWVQYSFERRISRSSPPSTGSLLKTSTSPIRN